MPIRRVFTDDNDNTQCKEVHNLSLVGVIPSAFPSAIFIVRTSLARSKVALKNSEPSSQKPKAGRQHTKQEEQQRYEEVVFETERIIELLHLTGNEICRKCPYSEKRVVD